MRSVVCRIICARVVGATSSECFLNFFYYFLFSTATVCWIPIKYAYRASGELDRPRLLFVRGQTKNF